MAARLSNLAALFFNLLLVGPVGSVLPEFTMEVQLSQPAPEPVMEQTRIFQDTGRDDLLFEDDVVINSTSRSRLDCARLCTGSPLCVSFTFVGGSSVSTSCCGYSTAINSTRSDVTAAIGAKTFTEAATTGNDEDPCIDHTLLPDDYRRDVNHGDSDLCDNLLTPGSWYRFVLNGSDATIPTYCMSDNHCGAAVPYWLDLNWGTLPSVGDPDSDFRVCGSEGFECCQYQMNTTVRNCGTFFVYKLQPTPACYHAYCTELQMY